MASDIQRWWMWNLSVILNTESYLLQTSNIWKQKIKADKEENLGEK